MKIYWLNPPITSRELFTDIGWMNFRHYCQDHEWIMPIIDWERYTTVDSLIKHIIENDAEILCISTYVWNHKLCHRVCREIKKICPDIITIQGGPHQGYTQDFFDRHPYIDYMCYATGHGENFLQATLQQIQEHGRVINPEIVPHMICREYQSLNEKSKFVYPETSSLEFSQDYLSELITLSEVKGYYLKFVYETTRGCPYGCTYCEWGGGTSTKVSIKPLDVIKRDIDLMAFLRVKNLEFSDANVGILERDFEVLEYIGHSKIKYGYPQTVSMYGLAKTKLAKKEKYLDMMREYGLAKVFNLSVQAIDPVLLTNLKRTDIPLEDNVYLAKKFSKDVSIHLELLLGIPGYTLDHFYKEFDVMKEANDGNRKRYILFLLPDSEIYSDVQRKLWKIKTITVRDRDNDFYHVNFEGTESPKSIIFDPEFSSPYDIMVSTFSYDTEDWKQMYIMNTIGRLVFNNVDQSIPLSQSLRQLWISIQQTQGYSKINNYLDNILTSDDPNKILDLEFVTDMSFKLLRNELGFTKLDF